MRRSAGRSPGMSNPIESCQLCGKGFEWDHATVLSGEPEVDPWPLVDYELWLDHTYAGALLDGGILCGPCAVAYAELTWHE
jgi:hypothetical protein